LSARERLKSRLFGTVAEPGPLAGNYWISRGLLEATRRIAASDALPAGDSLVDFGCGDRPYEPLFSAKFRRYIGADLPGNPRATVAIDEAGRLPLGDASADCVLSTQVLEHVSDAAAYLAEARRVLRPGGSLLLSTHGIFYYHPCPTDYWRWTLEGLKREITRAGFEVLEARSILSLPTAGLQLVQHAATRALPSALLRVPITLSIQGAIGIIETLRGDAPSEDGSVYVVLARST
jgi:SAM-dependent methyltransferase